MQKYCTNCGTPAEQTASFCQNCGTKFIQVPPYSTQRPNPYAQNVTPPPYSPYHPSAHQHQSAYQPHQTGQIPFGLIQHITQRIKYASIFWSIYGVLCAIVGIITVSVSATNVTTVASKYYSYYYALQPKIGGIVIGSLLLFAACINIIYAIIHFKYIKTIATNPAEVIRKIQSPAIYIISVVVNAICGGLVGIIGGVIMLTTRFAVQNRGTIPPYNYAHPYPPQPTSQPQQGVPRQPYTPASQPYQNTAKQSYNPSSHPQQNINEQPDTTPHKADQSSVQQSDSTEHVAEPTDNNEIFSSSTSDFEKNNTVAENHEQSKQ